MTSNENASDTDKLRTQSSPAEAERIRTFCRVCEPACGLIATVEDQQITRLEPDKDHPISKGFVCNKGIYGLDIHNDPDRLRTPLRRSPSGEFEAISWETALTEIAARLHNIRDTHGSDAIASYTGNPTAFNTLYGPSFGNFMRQLGARKHFSSGTQDCANKFAASEAVFGTRTLHPVPDLENADLVLLIGENPAVSHMSFVSIPNPMAHLKALQARGGRVIYVNPRKIESAASVGELINIRPDTDVYLLAALIHEIDRSSGFAAEAELRGEHLQELRNFVADYPADKVAGVTGISATQIRELAGALASAERACVHMSTGVNMGRQGTLAYWLLQMLSLVTGNLGHEGGNFYSLGFYQRGPAAGRRAPKGMLDGPFGQMRKPGGVGISLPGTLMASYISNPEEPIRALFVSSGNPLLSIAGETSMREALDGLDLLVCVDIYRNATAEHADYVLPAAGQFEREDINITGLGLQYQPSVQFTPAIVAPAYQRKPDWWIYESLAQAMGFDSLLDQESPDVWARIDSMLRSTNHSMTELRQQGVIALERSRPEDFYDTFVQTDTARVECFPDAFTQALQRMAELFIELENESPNQLKLISKRDAYMLNSWYANVAKLKKAPRDRNYLFMHPSDAEQRQIVDGSEVRVSNAFGELTAPVKLSEELMPGVVAMTHGWGHSISSGMQVAKANPGSNPNRLLPSGPGSFEPLSNQAHMTGINVDVVVA